MTSIAPKADIKFFVSWIVCSSVMFTMSYFWHGVILNDFLHLNQPKDVFLALSSVIYLAIGLLITALTYVLKRIKNSFKYGLAAGALVGVFIYMITFVFGVSFNDQFDMKMVLIDLGWQVLEQSAGGLWCGWVYRFMYIRESRQV